MSQDENEKGFTVKDRRRFDASGNRRDEEAEKERPEPAREPRPPQPRQPPQPPQQPPPPRARAPGGQADLGAAPTRAPVHDELDEADVPGGPPGPLGFAEFVLSIATNAVIHMGGESKDGRVPSRVNLPLA